MLRSYDKNAKSQIAAYRQKANAYVKQVQATLRSRVAEREATHGREKIALQGKIVHLQQACRDAEAQQAETVRDAEIEQHRTSLELAELQKRWTALESFNGRLWERELAMAPPLFVDMTRRKCRLISIMNLKGGVGKTTLTANIGVGLARKGYRVLMVDTDFQGSLTRLCIDFEELKESITRRKTTDHLLEIDPNAARMEVNEIAQRVRSIVLDEGRCDMIAATEGLAEAELRAQGRWLAIEFPDARFLFRDAFHKVEVLSEYDYIFFDCPPRLTTASINSLACSDFLLVPVILEQGSVKALPRTLAWLNRLPHVAHARLLGVVANRAEFYAGKLISAQKTILDYLPETVKRSGFDPTVFNAVVRNNRRQIEDAANRGCIAAATDDGFALFEEVIAEVEKGTRHESVSASTAAR